eukprot:gene5967-4276_t
MNIPIGSFNIADRDGIVCYCLYFCWIVFFHFYFPFRAITGNGLLLPSLTKNTVIVTAARPYCQPQQKTRKGKQPLRPRSISSGSISDERRSSSNSGDSEMSRHAEPSLLPSLAVADHPFRVRSLSTESTRSSNSTSPSSSSVSTSHEDLHPRTQRFFRTTDGIDVDSDLRLPPAMRRKSTSFLVASLEKGNPTGLNATLPWEEEARSEMSGGSETIDSELTWKPNERMNYAVVEDPRNYIINMIMDSATGSVELSDISKHLQWESHFEKNYGTVAEYLQGYHSIFVVSPIYDRVTLCRPVISSLQKSARRRHRHKSQTAGELVAAHIGSISCCCVAEEIDVEELQSLYRRRGYDAEVKYDVLHVSSKNVFDLFVFQNGFVVWWGMNRREHWIVEDDFFSSQSSAQKALKAPFSASDIGTLFPDWSSFEVDESYLPLKVDDEASERFSKMLCFDHYRIPAMEPDRTDVMLTVSYCVGRSACIDYYEHVTQTLHRRVLSIPLEFSGLFEYFSTQTLVNKLEGELQLTQLALTTLKDTPDFLWEMPWLNVFYDLTEVQCTAEQRLSWFSARGVALLEKLSSIKNRRFRLFMLGSDVFLIGLLIFDGGELIMMRSALLGMRGISLNLFIHFLFHPIFLFVSLLVKLDSFLLYFLAMNYEDFSASFTVTKHSWRGKYFRVLSFGHQKLITMDLKGLLRITNSWDTHESVVSVLPDPSSNVMFTVNSHTGGRQNTMVFSCFRAQERMELLTAAHRERMCDNTSSSFEAVKYIRGTKSTPTRLRVSRISVDELTEDNQKVKEFLFMHIKGYTVVQGCPNKLIIAYGTQLQLYMFQLNNVKQLVDVMNANAARYVGMPEIEKLSPMSQEQFDADRIGFRNDSLESIAEFPVTFRHETDDSVSQRLLCVTHSALVEREVDDYTTARVTLLQNIFSLVRCDDDDQRFLIEYKEPHVVHSFVSPLRDSVLGQICSVARVCQNNDICIVPKLRPRSMRFGMLRFPIPDEVESSLLYYLAHPEKLEGIPSPSIALIVEYFNANVSYSGLRFTENRDGFFSENREGAIQDAIESVLANYPLLNKPDIDINRFSCLRRLCLTRAGFGLIATSAPTFNALSRIVLIALRQDNSPVHKEVVDLLCVLVVSHHQHYELRHEVANKTNILGIAGLMESLMEILRGLLFDESKITVLQSLLTFFVYIICSPYSEATPSHLFTKIFNNLVKGMGKELFWLLDSSCVDIQINAARLLRAMVEEGDEAQFRLLQSASVSEGGFLHQFHVSVFCKNIEQRDLARCLISYWAYNNTKIHDLLRRMVPVSLLLLLQSKERPGPEEVEKRAERTYTAATDEYHEKRKSWLEKTLKQAPIRRETVPEPPVILRVRNIRVNPSLNWPLFFSLLKRDHRRPDLIWNHATRMELRQAVEKELLFLKTNAVQRNSETKMAWNYLEFEVSYPSLEAEVKIGEHYPRLLFESTEPQISRPKEFFNDLYHRFLLATESKEKLFCLQGMTILCKHYAEAIGYFHDIPYFVIMLRNTVDPLFRDALIDFFFNLLEARHNIKGFIDSDGPAVLAELAPLAHLHVDRPKSYVVTNAIEQASEESDAQSTEKEWYYTAQDERKGPYSFTEMKRSFEEGTIDGSTKVWAQGLSGWKELQDVPQLRWGIICARKPAIFTLSELTTKILDVFLKLCRFYASTNEDGAVISPLPKIKRFLTGSMILPHIVQLLLTFDPSICSRVHTLLYDLMENNTVVSRFYYTGVFFFSLMYNGSDILPLVKLLRLCHRQQSYKYVESANEVVRSSILAPLLPPSMICTLTHNEPDEFVKTFLGESESPEVMWGHDMRHFMMARIAAHLGDFTPRLLGNIHVVYQYCPIGMIEYETLKNELFCHEYYLRLLCDCSRFPDWKIREPVQFLSELLTRWKAELNKKPSSLTLASCCAELELSVEDEVPPTPETIRHAYLKLMPKYHPDKNPDGREKFESIQKAYEFLVSHQHTSAETATRENLHLLLKAQSILYQRCGKELSSFKYAGFRMLMQLIQHEMEDAAMFRKEAVIIDAATELCCAVIANVPLNADELREEGGIPILGSILRRAFEQITDNTSEEDIRVKVASHCMATFAIAGNLEDCRAQIADIHDLALIIAEGINHISTPALVKHCVEACGALSVHPQLQNHLISAGVEWFLLRLVFFYDITVEMAGVHLDAESNKQVLRNSVAISALRSLYSLAGIVPDAAEYYNSSPSTEIQRCLDTLLTTFITKKMKTEPHSEKEILQLLTTNTDNPYFLWNNSTRSELLSLVEERCENCKHSENKGEGLLAVLDGFSYSAHKEVLQIDGVYIQSYVAQPKYPVENPRQLFLSMCSYLQEVGPDCENKNVEENCLAVVKGLRNLLLSYSAVAMEAACLCAPTVLKLVDYSSSRIVMEALDLLEYVFSSQAFISAAEESGLVSSTVGRLVVHQDASVSEKALSVMHLGLTSRGIVEQSLQQRVYVLFLLLCLRDSSTQVQKEKSAQSLSIAFSDKLIGPQVYHACTLFLPRVLLDSMKENWRVTAPLLTTWQDNPELFWTEEKKKRVEEALTTWKEKIFSRWNNCELGEWPEEERIEKVESGGLSDISVGGVYLQSYQQNPGWLVRNPKEFAVALMERFLFEAERSPPNDSLILLVTSCALQLFEKSPHLSVAVAPMGYMPKILSMVSSSHDNISVASVRLINALSRSSKAVEVLSKLHVIRALMNFIADHSQHLLLWLQTIEAISSHADEKCTILQQSLDYHLIEFLLRTLSDSSATTVPSNNDPAVVRALIVRVIKKLQGLPEPLYAQSFASLMDSNPVWTKYKDHSHDLFLGNGTTPLCFSLQYSFPQTSIEKQPTILFVSMIFTFFPLVC